MTDGCLNHRLRLSLNKASACRLMCIRVRQKSSLLYAGPQLTSRPTPVRHGFQYVSTIAASNTWGGRSQPPQNANVVCDRKRPLWVRLGSRATQSRLPLFPQQQTLLSPAVTSEKCQQRKSQSTSLNNLVGTGEKVVGNRQPQRLGRAGIQD